MSSDLESGHGDERTEHLSDEKKRLFEKLRGRGSNPSGNDAETETDAWTPLVPIQTEGEGPPFFLVHAILGSIFPYHRLGEALGSDRPVYGLQARGLDGRRAPLQTIPEMARAYIEAIRTVQPHGPYLLCGYSMGGWIAFEMAQQLRADGDEVACLATLGTPAPPGGEGTESWRWAIEYMNDFFTLWRNTALADSPDLQASFFGAAEKEPSNTASGWPTFRVMLANAGAQARYLAEVYEGAVDVYLTPEQTALYRDDPTMGWTKLCSREVAVYHVEGNHLNLFQEPQVLKLAELLSQRLDEVAPLGGNNGSA